MGDSHSAAPVSAPQELSCLMEANKPSKPLQGGQTVHNKNSPFLMGKE